MPSDDPADRKPSDQPLEEAGQGESEGFELAERDLVEHASHGDSHGTGRIGQDAAGFDDPEDAGSEYGEADQEQDPDA